MLKFSLIIPVYNEERHIRACLEAIEVQTDPPNEVIVVDNNCTDNTIKIAKEFDFVSVIKEPKQGRGYARTAGFNAASGDILGRIDADSRISTDWVERVKYQFNNDPNLAGITGIANTNFLPIINNIKSKLASRSYFWFAHAGFDIITMWGANMATKSQYWEEVKDKVCLDDSLVHEDQDLSIWIAATGGKIIQDNRLLITTNSQTYRYAPKMLHYIKLYENTKKLHKENGNLRSKKLHKLGFRSTIVGRIFGTFFALYMLIGGTILFPLDFYMLNVRKDKNWLD